MKKLAVLIIILFVAWGCKKNLSLSPSVSHHSLISFLVIDKDRKNLLDPKEEGFIDLSNLDLYFFRDGQSVRQYYGNLTHPKRMQIYRNEQSGEYSLLIYVDVEGDHGSINRNIIEYNNGMEADTIDVQVYFQEGNKSSARAYDRIIWINGEEFDLSTGEKAVLIKGVN